MPPQICGHIKRFPDFYGRDRWPVSVSHGGMARKSPTQGGVFSKLREFGAS
jgi:hypothetical protein